VRQTAPADACLPAWLAEPSAVKLCLRPLQPTKSNAAHTSLAACTSRRSDGVQASSPDPRRSAGRQRWRHITRCRLVAGGPLDDAVSWSRARSRSGTTVPTKGVTEVLFTHVREVTASTITTGILAVAGAGFARRSAGAIVVINVSRSRPSA
jgi:hypothetical protein